MRLSKLVMASLFAAASLGSSVFALAASAQCRSVASEEMEMTTVCVYNNTTQAEAYRQWRQGYADGKYLRAVFPVKAVQDKMPDNHSSGLVVVDYQLPKGKKVVELQFQGGVTTVEFRNKGKHVESVATHSAD